MLNQSVSNDIQENTTPLSHLSQNYGSHALPTHRRESQTHIFQPSQGRVNDKAEGENKHSPREQHRNSKVKELAEQTLVELTSLFRSLCKTIEATTRIKRHKKEQLT